MRRFPVTSKTLEAELVTAVPAEWPRIAGRTSHSIRSLFCLVDGSLVGLFAPPLLYSNIIELNDYCPMDNMGLSPFAKEDTSLAPHCAKTSGQFCPLHHIVNNYVTLL